MTHPLLTAPIGPSLWKLARPTTVVVVAQTFVTVAEAYFIGRLGTDALAGFALVLPFVMLMITLAATGIGGGITSAMARTVGAGRIDDARALVIHGLIVAVGSALLFTLLAWTVGPVLYRSLGGRGAALAEALVYSNALFTAAPATWANYSMGALLRGAGDAATPARYMLWFSLAQIPLLGVLMLGVGDWPGVGMAGTGIAVMMTSGTSALLQARIIWAGRLGFRPSLLDTRLRFSLFRDILRVGVIASAGTVINNITAISITGLVGRFGTTALAGYGIALRLEFTLIPLLFGLGAALTTLVGVATGARSSARAIRIAWIGSTIGGIVLGGFGLATVFLANAWMKGFTNDPSVIEAGVSYLRVVGCVYWALGFATCLNLASQGAGRMGWPLVAALARLMMAATGGWCLVTLLDAGIAGVFAAVAAGVLVYAGAMTVPLFSQSWAKADR